MELLCSTPFWKKMSEMAIGITPDPFPLHHPKRRKKAAWV